MTDVIAQHASLASGVSKGSATSPSPRARLMSAATRLFCRHGINATGIDAIVAEAGTAKTTLYKLFGSKTDLVEAVLLSEGQVWRDWFFTALAGGATPRARLDAIFPALKAWFAEDDYYGCVFINAVGEHDKADSRLRAITLKHKQAVLGYISDLARDAGAAHPDMLTHQIGILMDGAIVAAMVTRDPGVADAAAQVADGLLNAACRLTRRKATSRLAIPADRLPANG